MANDLTRPKGMNNPQAQKAGKAARDVGMVTDGVSLEKGYKVVSVTTTSPQAVAQNKTHKTPGAVGSY